jgi:molecular chaperone DnaJ
MINLIFFGFKTITQSIVLILCSNSTSLYEVLGVRRCAETHEIKDTYRRIVRRLHPDINKENGAEKRFEEVTKAYKILSNPEQREKYDRSNVLNFKTMSWDVSDTKATNFDKSDSFSAFENFFNSESIPYTPPIVQKKTGKNKRIDICIDFKEAVFGCSKDLRIKKLSICKTCSGSGRKLGFNKTICRICNGKGLLNKMVRTNLGTIQKVLPCADCNGYGIISLSCEMCCGTGRVNKYNKIKIKVPAGVDNGSRLRIKSEGDIGQNGGSTGDLIVFIMVNPERELVRVGSNICTEITIPYYDAILGTIIQVRTLDGILDVKVPSGTQPNSTLTLSRMGAPNINEPKTRGNHIIKVNVFVPQILVKEKKLIEEIKKLHKNHA